MVAQHPDTIRDPLLLRRYYDEGRLSSNEIGVILGVSGRLVRTWLKRFNITTRSQREANNISAPKYLGRQVVRYCHICGKEFKAHLYRSKKSTVLYCSRECQIKDHASSLQKAKEKFRGDHPRIDKTCPVCGKNFVAPYSGGRRKHCSNQCKGVAQMIANAKKRGEGPNHIEQRVIDITEKHFPDFKFNGNGDLGVVLGGMIPDLVNVSGQKKVIEVFGDYYHGPLAKKWKQTELGKRMAYNYLGYSCLILWESEIKAKSDEELIIIIGQFAHVKGGSK